MSHTGSTKAPAETQDGVVVLWGDPPEQEEDEPVHLW